MMGGTLYRRVDIMTPVEVVDATGEAVTTYERLVTVRAHRIDRRVSETDRAGQTTATIETTYVVRWPGQDLDAKMRIVEGDRTYSIGGLLELPGRRKGYEITVRSLDPTGKVVAA